MSDMFNMNLFLFKSKLAEKSLKPIDEESAKPNIEIMKQVLDWKVMLKNVQSNVFKNRA